MSEIAPLAELLRWVGELPAAFRADGTETRAVVNDLFETLCGAPADEPVLAAFGAVKNHDLWVLAACHTLWHPTLRAQPRDAKSLERLLVSELAQVAAVIDPGELSSDEERREELIRRSLRAIGERPPGESANEAEDRLKQVDSIERKRVLDEAEEREKRAREVREALAKKAAEEAVPKVGRE